MVHRGPVAALTLMAALACARSGQLELVDLDGRPVRPLSSGAARVTVFLFTATQCPISNRYAPEVRRVYEKFGRRGVRFWLVYADPEETPPTIRRHVEAYGYALSALRDPHHTLVRLTGARHTPEAAVFVGSRLAYRGRIDDWYVDFGRSRAAPTTHDLEDALESVLAGRPVQTPTTEAVGCFIPELR